MTDSEIIDSLLAKEGAYVNHPADRGGPTNMGVTQATLSEWMSRPVTIDEVKNLSVEVARDIYRTKYLQPFDHVDPELKPQVVDIAVNSGVSRAQQLLKQATERVQVRPLSVQLVIERLEFYAKIVKTNPSQSVFLLGWIRRATSYLAVLLVISLSVACVGKQLPVRVGVAPSHLPDFAFYAAPIATALSLAGSKCIAIAKTMECRAARIFTAEVPSERVYRAAGARVRDSFLGRLAARVRNSCAEKF